MCHLLETCCPNTQSPLEAGVPSPLLLFPSLSLLLPERRNWYEWVIFEKLNQVLLASYLFGWRRDALELGLENIFCKRPDSNYFRFGGLYLLCWNLKQASTIGKWWARLCSNKILSMDIEMQIFYNFHLPWNRVLSKFFQLFKSHSELVGHMKKISNAPDLAHAAVACQPLL